MAQPQQNITIPSPGFLGLNLEDAPIDMDQRFALKADNAVIDEQGRLGARKGFKELVTFGPFVNYKVKAFAPITDGNTRRYIGIMEDTLTTSNKVFEYTALDTDDPIRTELTLPAGHTLPGIPQILDFAGRGVILSTEEMLIIEGGVIKRASAVAGWLPPQDDGGVFHTTFNPNVGLAAFGRLWVSGVEGNTETLYYSNLLNPGEWYDGKAVPTIGTNTGGIIGMADNWPVGKDRIMGMSAHNNQLIVFGRESILVWGNPSGDPAAIDGIFLQDTIKGQGLVDRDAIAKDGRDVLYVDDTGLRSLGRTIQEKSAPLTDMSSKVHTAISREILAAIQLEGVSLAYSPGDSFLLLMLRGANDVWVADTRVRQDDGSFRITRWPSADIRAAFYLEDQEQLLLGSGTNGMCTYEGTSDYATEQGYTFEYGSPIMSFGDPVRLKFIKQVDYTCVTGRAAKQGFAQWGYIGNRPLEKAKSFPLKGGGTDYYDQAVYGAAEYGLGAKIIRTYRVNASGSGENVYVGFKLDVNGSTCSLQQINIQALIGRIN
jgi:hypothetical protein